jgi:hypothetical protein
MARQLAMEDAAVPVRPVHHGGHREAVAIEVPWFFFFHQSLTGLQIVDRRWRMRSGLKPVADALQAIRKRICTPATLVKG